MPVWKPAKLEERRLVPRAHAPKDALAWGLSCGRSVLRTRALEERDAMGGLGRLPLQGTPLLPGTKRDGRTHAPRDALASDTRRPREAGAQQARARVRRTADDRGTANDDGTRSSVEASKGGSEARTGGGEKESESNDDGCHAWWSYTGA